MLTAPQVFSERNTTGRVETRAKIFVSYNIILSYVRQFSFTCDAFQCFTDAYKSNIGVGHEVRDVRVVGSSYPLVTKSEMYSLWLVHIR